MATIYLTTNYWLEITCALKSNKKIQNLYPLASIALISLKRTTVSVNVLTLITTSSVSTTLGDPWLRASALFTAWLRFEKRSAIKDGKQTTHNCICRFMHT